MFCACIPTTSVATVVDVIYILETLVTLSRMPTPGGRVNIEAAWWPAGWRALWLAQSRKAFIKGPPKGICYISIYNWLFHLPDKLPESRECRGALLLHLPLAELPLGALQLSLGEHRFPHTWKLTVNGTLAKDLASIVRYGCRDVCRSGIAPVLSQEPDRDPN